MYPADAWPVTSLRLANLAAIAVPLALGLAIFLFTWRVPTVSGAGLSEENRPIGFFMMAVFAAGRIIGTSAMFTHLLVAVSLAPHRPAVCGDRRPRPAVHGGVARS